MTIITNTTLSSFVTLFPQPAEATPDRPARPFHWSSRATRVNWLVGLIFLCSAIDLALTLQHMTTIGMFEANPLARWIVETTGSPWALSGFKAALTLLAVAVFSNFRSQLSAEFGAWIGGGVLVALMGQWVRYSGFISTLDSETIHRLQGVPGWVGMG